MALTDAEKQVLVELIDQTLEETSGEERIARVMQFRQAGEDQLRQAIVAYAAERLAELDEQIAAQDDYRLSLSAQRQLYADAGGGP
jgi:hypothetical protein